MAVRAVLFDAGNTLLEIDHAAIAAHLESRGHEVAAAAVADAERRARFRLEHEQAAQPTRELGARQVGMSAVLFDPGGLWAPGDCPIAAGLTEAVELALG